MLFSVALPLQKLTLKSELSVAPTDPQVSGTTQLSHTPEEDKTVHSINGDDISGTSRYSTEL